VFHIGGCASCHEQTGHEQTTKQPDTLEPDTPEPEEVLPLLSGGKRFETEFGTFIAPNISPDRGTGIGAWTAAEFATSLLKGVSPSGEHYYPAFPYTSYARMSLQDTVDLKTFIDGLPPVSRSNERHQLRFPFSIRRGLGLWKKLYLSDQPIINFSKHSAELTRGQYLVEGLGHCGECHSPRNVAGGIQKKRWLAGAPELDGNGGVPNITPGGSGIADWEKADIAEYLSSGFTPEYDVVGGSMADVVDNTAHLSRADRLAIAAYLKAIPARQ